MDNFVVNYELNNIFSYVQCHYLCVFLVEEMDLLDNRILHNSLKPELHCLEPLLNLPVPTNLKTQFSDEIRVLNSVVKFPLNQDPKLTHSNL